MKILKILCAFAIFFAVNAAALSENEIAPVMSGKVEEAVSILKNESIAKDEKPAKIFALFDEYFDYVTIAKISLGKHLKTLNDSQKSQFFSAFEKRLKSSFIDKLALYTNQDMKVLGTNKPKSNRLNLETQIIGEDKNYSVVFKFFPDESDNWRVYDVDILGVSIVQTYRSQFGDGALSFNEILDRLNNANLPEDK